MNKPDNAVKFTVGIDRLFRLWLTFLKPIHKLTDGEMRLASELLLKRYELEKEIPNQQLLDVTLMSKEVRHEIMTKLKMDNRYMQVVLSRMRNKKFLIGNAINPKFVPMLNGTNIFRLLLYFEINEEKK